MLLQHCASLKLSNIYALGMVIAVLLSQKGRKTNEEIDINSFHGFAGGSLLIPSGRSYADNPPGNHKQREELRRDQRQLEELRQRRNQESARAIGAKPVNTTRRYATRRGKSVKTEEIYTDKTVTDGIMTVITIMTDF